MNSLGLTLKVRLYPTDQQVREFEQVTKEYSRLCTLASMYTFEHDLLEDQSLQKKLHHDLYRQFRQQSFLKSQMIESVFRTVIARYKSVKTQMSRKPFKYWDKKAQELYIINRDLSWLQKPIRFKRPQADYVRRYNYSLARQGNLISLNGVSKRLKVAYDHHCKEFLLQDWIKLGTAKLVKACNHWFLHVSYTVDLPEYDDSKMKHVVGLDRGDRFLVTAYDEHGKTHFVSGRSLLNKRRHYKYLRAKLQKKHTASARRKLKRIGHRENRYVTDMNHCISKTLVDHYGEQTLFVLEDLTNIRDVTEKTTKKHRYEMVSWPFYQLQQMLEYKALKNSSEVRYVDAYKTSQRCPKCGRIRKANRDHKLHEYKCDSCGFRTNDDRIGAMNIQFLGTMSHSGVKKPSFRKEPRVKNNNGSKIVRIYSE